ncbi:hypothetical protein ACWCQ0_50025 [Streptomyces massasporeus]
MPDEHRYEGLERSLRSALRGDRQATATATTEGGVTGGVAAGGTAGEAAGGAEASARAAFRAARDAGLHVPGRTRRTRRRDDWTPGTARRLRRRSLRTALAAALASVTLGGVAIAAVDLPSPFADEPAPAPTTPVPTLGGTTAPAAGTTTLPGAATSAPLSLSPSTRPAKDPGQGGEHGKRSGPDVGGGAPLQAGAVPEQGGRALNSGPGGRHDGGTRALGPGAQAARQPGGAQPVPYPGPHAPHPGQPGHPGQQATSYTELTPVNVQGNPTRALP